MRYFISHNGTQKGPWTLDQVGSKLSSKEITVMDYVFDDDSADWVIIMNYPPFESLMKDYSPFSTGSDITQNKVDKDEWFVLRGESKYGPFAYLDVVKMLQQKQLLEFDFVWNRKMPTWARISEASEFQHQSIKALKNSVVGSQKDIFHRRKHARAEIGASILLHNNSEVWKGRSVEISFGGAGLIIPASNIQVGQDLFLHFKAGDEVPPFNAVCKIVSKSKSKSNEYRYGVKFTNVSQSVQVAIKKFTDENAA